MKLLANLLVALSLCQTQADPTQAISSTAAYKQNSPVAQVTPWHEAIKSIVNKAGPTGSRTSVGRIATLSADNITLAAQNDINLSGTTLYAKQDLNASAGGAISTEAVQTGTSWNIPLDGQNQGKNQESGGHHQLDATTQQVTSLKAGNNISLVAAGNASLLGSNAQAGNSLSVSAANISIEAAIERLSIDQQGITDKGYIRAASTDETLIGANFNAGNKLTLIASGTPGANTSDPATPGHILLAGAQLNTETGQTSLIASGDVVLQTVTISHHCG